MKRRDLIRHLEQHGCRFKREGGSHSIYARNDKSSAIPRHREIENPIAYKICAKLGVARPGKK
ncbi:MAG: type II toxin-antitoxin system HicA family toxin [Gammaproteobacteria bacterium]